MPAAVLYPRLHSCSRWTKPCREVNPRRSLGPESSTRLRGRVLLARRHGCRWVLGRRSRSEKSPPHKARAECTTSNCGTRPSTRPSTLLSEETRAVDHGCSGFDSRGRFFGTAHPCPAGFICMAMLFWRRWDSVLARMPLPMAITSTFLKYRPGRVVQKQDGGWRFLRAHHGDDQRAASATFARSHLRPRDPTQKPRRKSSTPVLCLRTPASTHRLAAIDGQTPDDPWASNCQSGGRTVWLDRITEALYVTR